ncbi:cobyrinate a,c-diamide synthase [Bilifractor sp. HCP3S3_D3]|uniref:cobyrinate a,c-diamide synthase n=1 Tax=Bilifractor sp. HCP3S3_D3 TaxID=3438907 RepID=UPI003F8B6C4D
MNDNRVHMENTGTHQDNSKKISISRIMIAAPSSGSGKTLITCGLLNLLKKKGLKPASFKCGPDFIDPMFHTKVLGTRSRNLDTFFTDPDTTRGLLARNAKDADLAVLEGVMGYFDGMGIDSSRAGASDLASVTDTPVLLIVPAKGVSRSVLPLIRGFLDFQEKPCIRGLILNRVSAGLYPRMKEMIEREAGVPVVGYVPVVKDCALESRHLGLLMPDEIASFQDRLDRLADVLDGTLDLEQILKIAGSAPALTVREGNAEKYSAVNWGKVRIGLAKDEAFCFFYADNLDLLREMGAELVPFSPIHDACLPDNLDGLMLHGGYPELYGKELGENASMRESVRRAVTGGLPTLAECGGFLYLHRQLTDLEGNAWPMAGVFPESAYYTGRLTRFGYVTLTGGTMFGRDVGEIRSHEFHYYESEDPGSTFLARKPVGNRSWRCVRSTDTLYAGFPHLYFYANPGTAEAFIERCAEYHANRNL